MALQKTCSSSSSSTQTCTYDVFVSFYGKDTRLSFTDHLFAALYRNGIHTFRDDRKLRRGKDIQTELEKAIETSRIAIIVFSTNYAASRWCLDELAKIMECEQRSQQIVLPVFYDVDPSDVRNQKGSLEKAFAMHEERFREGQVARWRAALTKAASLSGWDLHNVAHRFESELIEKIIGDISNKLNLEYFMVASYPVGLETRMQNLSKLLNRDSSDVHMVGIWGIGGIGKTTIAKAIYNQLQRKFEGSCFLEDVREIAKKPNGLIDLQELILSSVHVNDNRKIKHVDQGTMVIKKRAWCKRVLVVLDDVDHRDQLEKLAIRRGYFQPGSIIIITTRDKSMLKLDEVDEIYMPQELDHHESIKLLSWHAFGKDHPNENYAKLSKEVICYARGLPLALKVLGSFLSDKSTKEWEGTLEKLKVIPHDEIQEKLLVSFCSLSDTQKELFLDIACFFVGMEKNYTCKILQDSNLVLDSELGVLVRLSLVKIDCSNRLRMHDMIRDMGREVVRRQSTRVLGDRSRLWFHEDVLDVLQNHMGTEVVEGIMLNLPGDDDLQVDSKAFARMHRLRVLQLNFVRLKGNFQCPSKRLRYLEWYGFPLKTIPSDLHMENLVAIYMPYSSLIELWTGTKILQKLKFLDVSHSYHLMRTPDFSGITNLEVLVLNNCTSLVEVHNSVVHLDKLVTLDLADCKNLTKIPSGIYELKSDYVNLSGCTKLDMVPRSEFASPSTLRYSLRISSGIPLESIGFKISKLLQLKGLMDCASLVENHEAITYVDNLHNSVLHLDKLVTLDLADWKNLIEIPDLSGFVILEILFFTNCTSLVEVHNSVLHLDELLTLWLADCKNLTKIRYYVNLSGFTKFDMVLRFEFPSPSTLRYAFRMSSGIPLESFGFKISKLLQFGLTDCASLVKNHEAITCVDIHKIHEAITCVDIPKIHKAITYLDDLATRYSDLENCDYLSAINQEMITEIFELIGTRASWFNMDEAISYNDDLANYHRDHEIFKYLSHQNLEMMSEISKLIDTRASLVEIHEAITYLVALMREQFFPSLKLCHRELRKLSQLRILERCLQLLLDSELCLHLSRGLLQWSQRLKCSRPLFQYSQRVHYISVLIKKLSRVVGELLDSELGYRSLSISRSLELKLLNNFVRFRLPVVIFNFHNHLTILDVSLSRRFSSLDELPICLQALGANNATSLEWILTGSNLKLSEQLIISIGCSKLLKKDHTSNPRKKLLKELIARDRFSVFLPGAEFPDWFDYKSTGSILSFVVPPLVKQKIRGWFLCAVFSSRFHDIYGFTVICKFKNNTKGTELLYRQKNCRVIPCQEHLWLHSVPLHHVAHLLEAGDEVEYSIHVNGSFQPKKFGFNLIYENDKKDYQSYFEAMIQNASPPYKNDFLHEDVSTDQAMAGDQKIHPPYVQDQPSEGNRQRGWPYLHENPQGAMFFEGRAPFEQNLYLPGIPTMNSMSQTERLRSLEAERQLLHHQLENERRAHLATRENAAWASWQHRDQIAALESQLRIALAHGSQFAPQLYMDLPRPHFESESASSSQFATASSSSAPTQATISGLTPMASMRHSTLGLDYAAFLDSPALGIQSFNDPSRSTQSNRGSDLSQ